MKKNKALFPPIIFNVFKPARVTSYDVVRHFKRHLPNGFGKIGHFGTLDPFASGVLMIGISGAARLNDFVHEFLPKTYLAVGKLGVETPTGDYTSEIIQKDESIYLQQEVSKLPKEFLTKRWSDQFLGQYLQSPHKFSATKFEGKALHQWAREGVEIKKEAVERFIHNIEVIKFEFPYLAFRVTVSSGTYVRTLFSDLCKDLGTVGTLVSLVRESVGDIHFKKSLKKINWPLNKEEKILEFGLGPQEVLPFLKLSLSQVQSEKLKNGAFLKESDFSLADETSKFFWLLENEKLIGLGERTFDGFIRPKINFQTMTEDDSQ